MRKITFLYAILALLICSATASAQKSSKEEIFVDFPVNNSTINPKFRDNDSRLKKISTVVNELLSDQSIQFVRVYFCGMASPEGSYKVNKGLSQERLASLEKFVRSKVYIPENLIDRDNEYIPWDSLAIMVRESNIDNKAQILSIINSNGTIVEHEGGKRDSRTVQLMELDGGRPWKELHRRFFSNMRNAAVVFTVERIEKADNNNNKTYENKSQLVSVDEINLHQLKAMEYYNAGDLIRAYEEFLKAGGRQNIEYAYQSAFDICVEYARYRQLSNTSSESELLAFLRRYPSSKYYNEVSNMVAICKAYRIACGHSSESYDNAYRYATDAATRDKIKAYIEAARKQYLDKAISYYNNKEYILAYEWFLKIGDPSLISTSYLPAYNYCNEYWHYYQLNDNSTESDMISYLETFPNSTYYNEVSNRVAISKANKLTSNPSLIDYNEALKYARSAETITSVNNSYKRGEEYQKEKAKEERKRHKRWELEDNGGLINWGIGIFDMSFGFGGKDHGTVTWNTAFSMRIGNYKSPVQLELGLKLGVWSIYHGLDEDSDCSICYNYNGYDLSEVKYALYMPIFSRLKINLFRAGYKGEKCRFYVAALGQYSPLRRESMEPEFNIGGGCGWSWKECDVLFYYTQAANQNWESSGKYDDKFVGFGVTYYITK